MKLTKEEREIIVADVHEAVLDSVLDKLKERWWGTEREQLIHEVAESVRSPAYGNGYGGNYGTPPISGSSHGVVTVVSSEVPLGVECEAERTGAVTEIQIFPRRGHFYVQGIRSFNKPGEIWVERIYAPSSVWDLDAGANGLDSATWSLDHGKFKEMPLQRHLAYYRADWGCCNHENPIRVEFRSGDVPTGTTPKLRWTLYGMKRHEYSFGEPPAGATQPGQRRK